MDVSAVSNVSQTQRIENKPVSDLTHRVNQLYAEAVRHPHGDLLSTFQGLLDRNLSSKDIEDLRNN